MSVNSRKRYIRRTEIEKSVLVNDLTQFLNQINEFLIYPTPLYELLLNERNEVFLEPLIGSYDLEHELVSLKNQEKLTSSKKVDTFIFLRNISQNNNLFNFEKIELSEVLNYQKYISSNLKNLVMLKYSFIYYDLFNKFHGQLENKLNETFNSEIIFDFNEAKEELLDVDYISYKECFSIVFQLEEDFNLNEIIINLNDAKELDKFKVTLNSFDSNNFDLNDERFYDKLIQNYINPRIKLTIKSLIRVITGIIDEIKSNESDKIQINQTPFDNYFVFTLNINKFRKAGDWILSDLLEKLNNSNGSKSNNHQKTGIFNSSEKNQHQKKLVQTISAENTQIKPFIDFYNWILTEISKLELQTITEFSFHLEKKMYINYFEKVLEKFHRIVESYLDFCIKQHSKLLNISQFPEMIEESLLINEKIEKEDKILQLFEKLNKIIDNLNKIVNHRLVKDWFQYKIVNYHFISPCIALKNSGNYLNEEIDIIKVNDCEKLEFWENLTKLFQSERIISNCNISLNYVEVLYETYTTSKRIFRFDLITDEIFFNASLMTKFHKYYTEGIKNLFNRSNAASNEDKQIVSSIIEKKPLPHKNQEIEKTLQKLTENKVIKEISTYIIGI